MNKKKCIIIDLDGTLANIEHRRSELLKDNNWEKFNSKINSDLINLWCRELMDAFKSKYEIIIVTGRGLDLKNVTEKWLVENRVPYDLIFYRPVKDFRDDTIVKREIFEEYIQPSYETLFVVDDRNKIVKMWRDLGLICLQCAYADF